MSNKKILLFRFRGIHEYLEKNNISEDSLTGLLLRLDVHEYMAFEFSNIEHEYYTKKYAEIFEEIFEDKDSMEIFIKDNENVIFDAEKDIFTGRERPNFERRSIIKELGYYDFKSSDLENVLDNIYSKLKYYIR